MSEARPTQLETALERLLDAEPEPGDGPLLASAMRDDPALRREVSGLLALDELLRQNAELAADDFAESFRQRLLDSNDASFARRVQSALPIPSETIALSSRRRRTFRLLAAAAILLAVALLAARFGVAAAPEVATLLLAENCQWQNSQAVQEGTRLTTGTLRLRQGLAIVRFDSGAELMVRGEAEVVLVSAARARLVRGEVTVRAPEETAGFTLLTPAGQVVDLGTEFAARAEPSGATDLHVMEGEVAFSSPAMREQAGAVLPAGKAIRFDSATAGAPREVQLWADRFDAIILAARPTARAELMSAYEGFAYPVGRIQPPDAGGGFGWRGPWRAAQRHEAYRLIEDPIYHLDITDGGAYLPWTRSGDRHRNILELPAGTTSLARTLERPLALDRDGVYYFSLILHEPELAQGLIDREFGGVRLVFCSSAAPREEMLSFGPSRVRRPAIRTGNGPSFNSPLQIARNQNTLWVGKIIARRSGDDEIFFSVYSQHDAIDYLEPATWQVATRGVRRNGRLDTVLIAGQLSAPCAIDELRIGPTWRSVVPLSQSTEAP